MNLVSKEPVLKLGPFDNIVSVHNLLNLYHDEAAQPYIRLHLWGVEPETKTIEELIEEVLSGESTLSLESGDLKKKFVRDIGATITMRITCKENENTPPLFLQQFRRRNDGVVEKRRHRHTSVSEKQKSFERQALQLDQIPNDDWVRWWNHICEQQDRGTLDPELRAVIIKHIKRMLFDELGLRLTDEDLGHDRLKFVKIDVWKLIDTELRTLEADGTNISGSYLDLYTRNRLMCFFWDMPPISSNGNVLLMPDGYEEKLTKHLWRWIRGHRND